jgi:hypothetical protein
VLIEPGHHPPVRDYEHKATAVVARYAKSLLGTRDDGERYLVERRVLRADLGVGHREPIDDLVDPHRRRSVQRDRDRA